MRIKGLPSRVRMFRVHVYIIIELLSLALTKLHMIIPITIVHLCLKQQILAYHRLGHEFCHVVAEYIPVYKIEHSPTPSKVHKPPHQCFKV